MKSIEVFFEPANMFFVQDDFTIPLVVKLINHLTLYKNNFAFNIIINVSFFCQEMDAISNIFYGQSCFVLNVDYGKIVQTGIMGMRPRNKVREKIPLQRLIFFNLRVGPKCFMNLFITHGISSISFSFQYCSLNISNSSFLRDGAHAIAPEFAAPL